MSGLRRIGSTTRFNSGEVNSLPKYMEYRGRIMRRRDLLAAGFPDSAIRAAVNIGQIFRVRHGWYALPGTSDTVTRVVRVGGRLTGLAALRTMGMFLPPPSVIDVVVPRGAAGLRQPDNSRARLAAASGLRINWIDPPRGSRVPWDWIASEDEALACVLTHESREVAVACCDALVRYRGWTRQRLERVFAQASLRVQSWLGDVDGRADAYGETIVRVRVRDAGLPFEPQAYVPGVGHLDGKIGSRLFVEVDGLQHADDWSGPGASSFENDHDRDILTYLATGARTIRITYRQLEKFWPQCLAAIRRAYEEQSDA